MQHTFYNAINNWCIELSTLHVLNYTYTCMYNNTEEKIYHYLRFIVTLSIITAFPHIWQLHKCIFIYLLIFTTGHDFYLVKEKDQ